MKGTLYHLAAALAVSVAVYFAARPTERAEEDAPPAERADGPLQRRVSKLAALENPSLAMIGHLAAAGKLSRRDLDTQVREAARKDPEGTWRWLRSQGFDGETRKRLEIVVVEEWFLADPDEAMRVAAASAHAAPAILAHLWDGDERTTAAIVRHLDRLCGIYLDGDVKFPADRRAAVEAILALPGGIGRDALAEKLAGLMMDEDWREGVAFAGRLPEDSGKRLLENHALWSLDGGPGDEKAAWLFRWVSEEAPADVRTRVSAWIVEYLAGEDPAAAMSWAAEHLSSAPLGEAMRTILPALIERDPEEARRMVEAMPPGAARGNAAQAMLGALAQAEGDESALRWWLEQADGTGAGAFDRDYSFWKFADEWARSSSEELRDFIGSEEIAALPRKLVETAASNFAGKDPQAASEWAASLPEDRRAGALETTIRSWAEQDPAAAATWYGESGQALSEEAARPLSYGYYRADREAAIGWAASLPAGSLREGQEANLRRMLLHDRRLEQAEKARLLKLLE